MNKTFFKIGLGALILAGMTWSSRGDLAGMKTLSGHVPAVVSRLSKIGDLETTNVLRLAIGLQVRNAVELDDLVHRVSDPRSAEYGQYLTAEKFTEKFAPSEADYQAVVDFAKAQGLVVTRTHANRMLVDVEGNASAVEKAFGVSLHTYQHPTENREFFAPDRDPSVPAGLAIIDISGLNNYVRPHTSLRTRSVNANAKAAPASIVKPSLGSGPDGNYMGYDFRAAYVPGTTLVGTGQRVALVQFDGYLASDIALYETNAGLPSVALTNILIDGFNGAPTGTGGEVEVSLDIEMVVSMAPGVDQILVYEGNPESGQPNDVLNQIAVDDRAHQISCSWGWGGGPNGTTDEIFKEMIVQGQTFYHATGDFDAFLPGEADNPDYPFYPSSDPYITQVGGTTLSTTGPQGAFVSETVWNWGVEYGDDGAGTCGGVSSYYTIPWWQTNVSMTANGGSTTYRDIPDVALTADNILVIADGGQYLEGNGGTSCASPLWAGFNALINQQAVAAGHAVTGFINPALYALGASLSYTNYFRDVTTGNNTWSESPNAFYAVTNYDLCTGLGSPNGTNLINILTAVTTTNIDITGVFLAPVQPWGTNLAVMNGADPNGLWLLFFQDDTANSRSGTNYNGWLLNLTSANPVGFPADNQMFVDSSSVSVAPGAQWATTLAVTNYGPAAATNVTVLDTLPDASGVTLVSSSSSIPGASITVYGGSLGWTVGTLPVNTGGTLSLTFTGNVAGSYTNGATVSSSNDPNPDDDTVGVSIVVGAQTPPTISPSFSTTGNKAFSLSVTNVAGSTVVIQASTNLTTWVPVVTNVAPFTFTNFDNTNFLYRFYRAVITGQ
jgi:uncharacterized repeat protein (TIGR01451 family)